MSSREPIFIVGVQRSGTTLLSALLSAHSELSCGPETHFFRRLAEIEPLNLLEQQSWPELARDFVLSITHTNFLTEDRTPLVDKYQLNEEDISHYLKNHQPSVQTMLSSVTEQYMKKVGKKRWVEKTPDHILYLEMIRQYFPSSPIIRIVRDPRAVASSLTKVPWGAESFLHALISWKNIDLASNDFFLSDILSYTLYFEDLLKSPKQELINLCHFLDEEFEDQMLNTNLSGKQLNSRNVDWKAKASQPLDPDRIYAWKSELTSFEKNMAEAVIGDRIKIHGYELEKKFIYVGELFPRISLATKYQNELFDLLVSDIRFWKEKNSEKTSVKVFLGDPSADNWLRNSKVLGLLDSISIIFHIILDKFEKKSIYWILKKNEDKWSGYSASFLKKFLSPYSNISAP